MDVTQLYFVSVALLVLGGALCYVLRDAMGRIAGPLATLCSAGALLGGIAIAARTVGAAAAPEIPLGVFRLVAVRHWEFVAFLTFKFTSLTALLNAFAVLFGFCVVLYSLSYWRDGEDHARFYAFALWSVAGASVALVTRNLLVFLFAWEAVTVMLYLLVSIGGEEAKAGAAKTFSMLGFSDVALVLAIACLFARGPELLNIDTLQGSRIVVSNWAEGGLFALFLIAALAKAGAVPLHTWIPKAAEGAPVPTMALLPASLDKLLGIMLLARVSLGFFRLGEGLHLLLMVIGVVTILAAVMMAMVQHQLKKLLSFHAVSQVGYMVLGIGTGVPLGIVGGLFHMINNAVYKNLLFLGAGAVESRTGDLDLDNLGGLAGAMPLTAAAFMIGALAISGVPPLNGFVSKWMVYQGVIEAGGSWMPLLLAGAVLGSALTLASFVKAMHSVFYGDKSSVANRPEVREVGWNMLFPMGVLAGICVAFGVGGGYVARGILASVQEEFGLAHVDMGAGAAISSEVGLWGPLPAMALILLALVLGLAIYTVGRTLRIRKVRPFLAGEVNPPGPTHVSGTGFYLTVRNLPVLSRLYDDAESGALDVYRISGMLGSVVVRGLRALHTGVLEVYVTWVVVGVAAVVSLLFLLR